MTIPKRLAKVLRSKPSVVTRAVFWKIPYDSGQEDIHLKIGRYKQSPDIPFDENVLETAQPSGRSRSLKVCSVGIFAKVTGRPGLRRTVARACRAAVPGWLAADRRPETALLRRAGVRWTVRSGRSDSLSRFFERV